jgi:dolichol-phosphate mannosyltransferase
MQGAGKCAVKVSVILPTYNEAGNIVDLVATIKKQIPTSWTREILVVDDNSSDGTLDLVREAYAGDCEVKTILRTSDRGLATSIRTGIEAATGDYLLVMDTDFTHRPEEIPSMLHVVQIADLVNGSRFCPGGGMADTKHYMASFVYNLLVRFIIRTQIQDNLGGFWVADAGLIRRLPFDEIFFGYGDYYFRLLHFVQYAGMRVIELPSQYCERTSGTSKSNFGKLLIQYSAMVLKLALRSSGKKFAATTAKTTPVLARRFAR